MTEDLLLLDPSKTKMMSYWEGVLGRWKECFKNILNTVIITHRTTGGIFGIGNYHHCSRRLPSF